MYVELIIERYCVHIYINNNEKITISPFLILIPCFCNTNAQTMNNKIKVIIVIFISNLSIPTISHSNALNGSEIANNE